ncbi:MAG: SDR family NAD(P)-dependent oxidoreductase [Propionibacteriaceae bacterium]
MRRVLVTGAVGGMGAAIVVDLVRDREVIATARHADRLAELTAATGATGWIGDVTDHEWLAAQVATLDRLDEVVHVAAIGTHVAPEVATAAGFRAQLEVSLIAPAELTRLCLPLLRASRGTVIFIGSGASTRPVPGSAVYPATKHALKAYADVLRLDESRNGVRVATVAPVRRPRPCTRSRRPRPAARTSRSVWSSRPPSRGPSGSFSTPPMTSI